MRPKILALDLDGTLTNSQKVVTEYTKAKIRQAQEMGHIIVLASGRPTPGVEAVSRQLDLKHTGGYVLSYNGARIQNCKTGEILYQRTMPEDVVPLLFDKAKELAIGIMTYQKDAIVAGSIVDKYMEIEAGINSLEIHSYEEPMKQVIEPVNKCLATAAPEVAEGIEEHFREVFGKQIDVGRSEPFFIELIPKGVDKAESLAILCKKLGLTRDDLIACGDGFNDRSMVEYAGIGVAMANAQEVVKEVADYITTSNDEDGVAKVIDKFLINGEKL